MPANKAVSLCCAGVARTFVLAMCLVLAACGGGLVPVHNIQNAPVIAAHGQAPSATQVRDAIMRALVSRAWQIDREGPDGVVATTISRGNSATVLIRYDVRAYSISYLDSSPGLKFNGASIHRRYNDWVEKLDKSIRRLLADVDYYPVQATTSQTAAGPDPAPPGVAGLEEPPAPPPLEAEGALAPPPPAAGAPDVAPNAAAPSSGTGRPGATSKAAAQSVSGAPPPPQPPAPAARK